MKLKVNEVCLFISVAIVMIVAFFEAQLIMIASSVWVIPFLWFLSILFLLLASVKHGVLRISLDIPIFIVCWLLLCAMFIRAVLNNEILVVSKICFLVIYALLIAKTNSWLRFFYKPIVFFGLVAVGSTFFFYAFPDAYSVMVDFYGYYPLGTGSLEQGYRAGIFAHYSHNGVYISVFIMIMICRLLALKNEIRQHKQRVFCVVAILIGAIALLLTGKRGTTIWCALAMLLTWFVGRKNKTKGMVGLVLLSAALVAAFQIATVFIPQVNDIIGRFSVVGQDESSQERIAMWELAVDEFQEAPVFGIGFTNFRNVYMENASGWISQDNIVDQSYMRLDAHNVYLQVLCETGIVGLLIYLAALLLLMIQTIKLIKYFADGDRQDCKMAALVSFCIQVYYLAYSLTGNCLYDYVFYFYGLAIALTTTLTYEKKELIRKDGVCEKNRNSHLS